MKPSSNWRAFVRQTRHREPYFRRVVDDSKVHKSPTRTVDEPTDYARSHERRSSLEFHDRIAESRGARNPRLRSREILLRLGLTTRGRAARALSSGARYDHYGIRYARFARRMINYGRRDRAATRLVSHDHFLAGANFAPAAK